MKIQMLRDDVGQLSGSHGYLQRDTYMRSNESDFWQKKTYWKYTWGLIKGSLILKVISFEQTSSREI